MVSYVTESERRSTPSSMEFEIWLDIGVDNRMNSKNVGGLQDREKGALVKRLVKI